MASVADRLQLPGERGAELGAWRNPVAEPSGGGGLGYQVEGHTRTDVRALLRIATGDKCHNQARLPASSG